MKPDVGAQLAARIPSLQLRRLLFLPGPCTRALGPILSLFLASCAVVSPPPPAAPGVANPAAWHERQTQLADFDTWSLQGRAATGQLLGWSGNLSWRQRGETFNVRVSGPLGAGGFRAQGTLARVEIQTEDETFVTSRPEALVEEALGWRFPLTGLRYWILGLPAPGLPAELSVDERGLLVSLEQSGWRIGYTEYTDTGDLPLPRRIALHDGENTVKLVIDRWF